MAFKFFMFNSVLRPQTSLSSTSLLFTPSQRAWFPYTWTLSSHSLLGDMRPLEFTIMIKPFSTGKGLSLRESAIDHSVFLSRGLLDPIQDFNQVLLHVLIPLIHGLPIWGLLNSLLWSNLSPYWKRNWSYSVFQPGGLIFRLFEFQWFAVNH